MLLIASKYRSAGSTKLIPPYSLVIMHNSWNLSSSKSHRDLQYSTHLKQYVIITYQRLSKVTLQDGGNQKSYGDEMRVNKAFNIEYFVVITSHYHNIFICVQLWIQREYYAALTYFIRNIGKHNWRDLEAEIQRDFMASFT